MKSVTSTLAVGAQAVKGNGGEDSGHGLTRDTLSNCLASTVKLAGSEHKIDQESDKRNDRYEAWIQMLGVHASRQWSRTGTKANMKMV